MAGEDPVPASDKPPYNKQPIHDAVLMSSFAALFGLQDWDFNLTSRRFFGGVGGCNPSSCRNWFHEGLSGEFSPFQRLGVVIIGREYTYRDSGEFWSFPP